MKSNPALTLGALVAAVIAAGSGCSRARPTQAPVQADPQVLAQRQAFRAQQDEEMRGELSPLARIGFIELPDGEHRLGGAGSAVTLPAAALPAELPDVRLTVDHATGQVLVKAQPAIRKNGTPITAGALQRGEALTLGRLRLMRSGTPEKPALAVYDTEAPARRDYRGLHYFPDDEHYVVRARLMRHAKPQPVRLEASRGEPKDMVALGTLRFTVAGTECSLEAYQEQPGSDKLFLIFRDQSSGKKAGSYGAGRFLYATAKPDGAVTLDFNQAWNPLCAYSPWFHCPLPPRHNWLSVALPVGEKTYAEH